MSTAVGSHLDTIEFTEIPDPAGECAHAHEVTHPIIRSAEPGEDRSWCCIDNVAFLVR